jgi:hypothetical protein
MECPMASDAQVDVRPRTTGEILDDAWRLYLADAPLLWCLSGLFTVPAAVALLMLLTQPVPANWLVRCLLPMLTAGLLPLTGLGAGACQEVFRRRAEGKSASLDECLRATLRLGLAHAAARALVLTALAPGLLFLVLAWAGGNLTLFFLLALPCLLYLAAIMTLTNSAHPIVAAGKDSAISALWASSREAQRQAGKAAALTAGRLALWIMAIVNAHVFVRTGLWVVDDLAGFDLTLPGVLLSLGNPVYGLILTLLAWLLITPFAEASNCLFHVDARTRYEGLDLWYRIQRLFPMANVPSTPAPGRGAAAKGGGMLLLAVGAALLGATTVRGADRLTVVREVRETIEEKIKPDVEATDPFPADGGRWGTELLQLADRLEKEGTARRDGYRWFRKAVERFRRCRSRDQALDVLHDMIGQLALIEQSLQQQAKRTAGGTRGAERGPDGVAGRPARSKAEIKRLLPPESPDGEDGPSEPAKKSERKADAEEKKRVPRDDETEEQPKRVERRGSGIMGPQASGCGFLAQALLWGILALLVAGIVAAAVVFLLRWWSADRPPVRAEVGRADPSFESIVTQPDRFRMETLWRQADELARRGQFLEAVRHLYLAVLALLHRRNLIRFERMRTNGEYVQQLRAHEALHGPFKRLTNLFEVKWYGERSCQAADYQVSHGLAVNIRDGVSEA